MIRRPPRSTPLYSSAASDVYKRQAQEDLKVCRIIKAVIAHFVFSTAQLVQIQHLPHISVTHRNIVAALHPCVLVKYYLVDYLYVFCLCIYLRTFA
eukprot:TRINITY_DN988_c0_g1_i5.p3 TRINITY_DN988_c0_g1~~TRINITY_DN988_c0_g1_i5.p3  ORF type:complete len:104 (+),score=7.01 TRINITY_DN988_c0_g1_i5:25-312(+)